MAFRVMTRAIAALSCTVLLSGVLSGAGVAADDALVERGRYLVTIMACTECHTPGTFLGRPDEERYLAGGDVGFVIPGLGTVYAKNLTPDPDSGLGAWSDAEIERAIRAGVGRDGRALAPIMPWRLYADLTDDDTAAIIAYLRSLPPVRNWVPADLPPDGIAVAPAMPVTFPDASAFPFPSRYVQVDGALLHYVEAGAGDPILFLHGNPTSSYLWRNVMPYLEDLGRVIAVDNVGFGKSDKPDIAYTFADHVGYIEGFIDALDLRDITFVVHDWGSALGFHYASRHADNVKGIAFMEAIVAPAMPASYATMAPRIAEFFQTMRDPDKGPELVIEQNAFIEQTLFEVATLRPLSEAEKDAYRAPFTDPASRKPILVWPNQIPIDGEPADVVAAVEAYNAWLTTSPMPKLHLYAEPGALNPPEAARWIEANLPNTESVFVGAGVHYLQEDQPHRIGTAIADWYRRLAE